MKFEIRYPGGAVHEVALEGRVAVVGRDPSCDLVINDPKCSRRHAVVEAGPDGLVIRDSGSANGILVNGRRIERSPLVPGDVFRIGDVEVAVKGGVEEGTLIMDPLGGTEAGSMPPHVRTATLPPLESLPEDTTGSLPPAVAPPPPRPSARSRSMPPTAPKHPALEAVPARPLTLSVLSVLWVLSIPFFAVVGIVLAQGMPGPTGIGIAVTAALLALTGGVMSFGLWTAQGWARPAQVALAALGILNCPFALASIAVLVYMLRAPAKRYFARAPQDTAADQSEAVFAAAIVAAVVLGGLVTAGLTFVARTARAPVI